MKTFITFGQDHTHSINGKTLDKDTVAVIESPTFEEAMVLINEYFGSVYSFSYPEEYWDEAKLSYFPKGYVYI